MDRLIKALEAQIKASAEADEAWIARVVQEHGVSEALVRKQHTRMIGLAQGSHYTIRQIERGVEARLEGMLLTDAVDFVEKQVRLRRFREGLTRGNS
jgi:hypothetical protein